MKSMEKMVAAQLMDSSLNQRSQSSLQLLQDYSNVPMKNPNRRRDKATDIVTDFSAFDTQQRPIGPYNSHTVREGSLKALPLGRPYSSIQEREGKDGEDRKKSRSGSRRTVKRILKKKTLSAANSPERGNLLAPPS